VHDVNDENPDTAPNPTVDTTPETPLRPASPSRTALPIAAGTALFIGAMACIGDLIWWRTASYDQWWWLLVPLTAIAVLVLLFTRTSLTRRNQVLAGAGALITIALLIVDYTAITEGWLPRTPSQREIDAFWEQEMSKPPPPQRFDVLPRQYPDPPQKSSTANSSAPVGACATLTGNPAHSTLKIVECDSSESTFRIIQQAPTPKGCIKDADQSYYHNSPDEQFTACLDYYWQTNRCLAIQGWKVTNTACDNPLLDHIEKPIRVFSNVNTVNDCPTAGGFAHPVRRFTICTETQH
jgi:hypothetical protein